MTEITATLTGTLEWEYDESGSKRHDIVIKLSNGRRFPTQLSVFSVVSGMAVTSYRLYQKHYDFVSNFKTRAELDAKIQELLAKEGWTLKVEDKGSYNI